MLYFPFPPTLSFSSRETSTRTSVECMTGKSRTSLQLKPGLIHLQHWMSSQIYKHSDATTPRILSILLFRVEPKLILELIQPQLRHFRRHRTGNQFNHFSDLGTYDGRHSHCLMNQAEERRSLQASSNVQLDGSVLALRHSPRSCWRVSMKMFHCMPVVGVVMHTFVGGSAN